MKDWGQAMHLSGCSHCQSVMLSAQPLGATCPYCLSGTLSAMDAGTDRPVHVYPPEAYLPYQAPETVITAALERFAADIPFAPRDLNAERQRERMRPAFLPMWWVDAEVDAFWQAEIGFPYAVQSHEEHYENGRWQSREVREQRLRWEWRGGHLARRYDNTPAPALTYFPDLEEQLGFFSPQGALPYEPDAIGAAVVILPDHSPQDAWQEARYELDRLAQEECRMAADGQQIRQFLWEPNIRDKHWTHLLLPVYLSYYEVDQGERIPLYIHGQNGRVIGRRQASEQRARRRALWWMGLALLGLFTGLGLAWGLPLTEPVRLGVILAGALTLMAAWLAIRTLPMAREFNAREGRGLVWPARH